VNCKNDESGISSFQLWRSLKEIPTNGVKILPTYTNDFVLKSATDTDMLITKKEFNRGIYLGYWGKLVGD